MLPRRIGVSAKRIMPNVQVHPSTGMGGWAVAKEVRVEKLTTYPSLTMR
ncbi:MAG: hypothetical protein ACRBN8_25340 [Nannocystales bacterium]